MNKVNFSFNGTDYSIDESSISDFRNELKIHFNTMNGSGATINLDGMTYSIDAEKLASAKNKFVSHLSKIVGNGKKVVVDDVVYFIDSVKVSDAISELEVVLGNLNSNGGSVGKCIFPEKRVDFYRHNSTTTANFVECILDLSDGAQYLVVWDGVEYVVTAKYFPDDNSYLLGNEYFIESSTGEPFLFKYYSDSGSGAGILMNSGANDSFHIIAIYEYM